MMKWEKEDFCLFKSSNDVISSNALALNSD